MSNIIEPPKHKLTNIKGIRSRSWNEWRSNIYQSEDVSSILKSFFLPGKIIEKNSSFTLLYYDEIDQLIDRIKYTKNYDDLFDLRKCSFRNKYLWEGLKKESEQYKQLKINCILYKAMYFKILYFYFKYLFNDYNEFIKETNSNNINETSENYKKYLSIKNYIKKSEELFNKHYKEYLNLIKNINYSYKKFLNSLLEKIKNNKNINKIKLKNNKQKENIIFNSLKQKFYF